MSLLCKEQRPKLKEALISSFPNKEALKEMLRYELDKPLDTITADGDNLTVTVDKVIEWAESRGQLEELVRGAVSNNSGNEKLQDFLESIDIKLLWNTKTGDIPISDVELENLISNLEKIEKFDLSLDILESIYHTKAYENLRDKIEEFKAKKIKRPTKIILLLKILFKDYPKDNDNGKQLILNFTERLKQEQQISNNRQGKQKKDKDKDIQAYLLIVVQPASLPDDCILKAFLAFEESTNEYHDSNFIPLRNDKLIVYKFKGKEIKKQISQFIHDSQREIRNKFKAGYTVNDLIIEFFLPNEYIFEPIDMWKITYGGSSEEVAIGIQYRMAVRAWERLKPKNELYLNNLRNRWERINKLLEETKQQEIQDKFVHFSIVESNLELLASQLYEKIGLKLTCVPSKSKKKIRDNLLNAVFAEGVPIVIWTRCSELPEKDIVTEIGKFLTLDYYQNLGELLKIIRQERMEAKKLAAKNKCSPERYLGHHLAILCDEWNRLSYLADKLADKEDRDMLRIGR